MTYLDLRKAFHDTAQDADQLYDRRFNDERTWHLKTSIAGSPAFVYMAPEIYEALLEAARISDPHNVPDGTYFRTKMVHVINEAGIPIHDGIEPEARIIEEMDQALDVLNDESREPLLRIALFHFLFGYIHPFYDGNGRTNRFISSYLISRQYEPIVGLGISHAVKQEIEKYYKAFSRCEHPLNRGDITPFVIAFSEICVNAMCNLRDALTEKKSQMDMYLHRSAVLVPEPLRTLVESLITATLFTFDGVTAKELCEAERLSRQTLYKRLSELRKLGLLQEEKIGRKVFYKLNEEAFLLRGC